jgi:hypothetical protein
MSFQERTSLQFYLRFREQSPDFLDVLKFNVPLLLFWVVMVAGTLAFAAWSHVSWSWLVPGIAIGAALRDLRRLYTTASRWPWLRGIIDWHEVERRLA